jgi:single-stranded-DNA-specific exonuclease
MLPHRNFDGATASVVAVKSLRLMGAEYVDFLVPNRFEHGNNSVNI